ncbi:NADPH-dependent F420 reductase [Rhizobium halophytocola]|uniref:Dinucleotide-binding enzyme n=1 Tax=Rhizobium halophytocola TaxID=735519 RepID=A0ABS4DZT7_9HYPH|nr:putative dinucleotide-binding enzyme [Rhizobium halophytocola]
MKIAIIGAGNVGTALATGWSRGNHAIAMGVRDPNDPKHGERPASEKISIRSVAEAVTTSDVIVLAVHWHGVADALAACGDLKGRVIIDVTNPLEFTPTGMELAFGFSSSAGERVADLAKGAKVVKTLNQVGASVMANARGRNVPPAMFVASDFDDAKKLVFPLVRELGFAPIDGGGLKTARLLEPLAMLWIDQVYTRNADQQSAFAFVTH